MDLYSHLSSQIKSRPSKKLAGNTYLTRDGDTLVVTLYETQIVRLQPDNSRTFTTGGWLTPTTKGRICEFGLKDSGWGITSQGGIWQLFSYQGHAAYTWVDGIGLNAAGEVVGGGPPPELMKAQRSLVRGYVARYMKAWGAGEVPAPNGGDPWNISMTDDKGNLPLLQDGAKYITELAKGTYYYGSLLYRAMEFAMGITPGDTATMGGVLSGAQLPPKYHTCFSRVDLWVFGSWLATGKPSEDAKKFSSMSSRRLSAALSSYLLRYFGLPPARS